MDILEEEISVELVTILVQESNQSNQSHLFLKLQNWLEKSEKNMRIKKTDKILE